MMNQMIADSEAILPELPAQFEPLPKPLLDLLPRHSRARFVTLCRQRVLILLKLYETNVKAGEEIATILQHLENQNKQLDATD